MAQLYNAYIQPFSLLRLVKKLRLGLKISSTSMAEVQKITKRLLTAHLVTFADIAYSWFCKLAESRSAEFPCTAVLAQIIGKESGSEDMIYAPNTTSEALDNVDMFVLMHVHGLYSLGVNVQ